MDRTEDIALIGERLSKLVNRENKRLTHKIRTARYYGGVATIDVVGCYLDCAYCWVPDIKKSSDLILNNIGRFNFMSPVETADILTRLASTNELGCVRLSGGEPTLNKAHLIETIDLTTERGFDYILETNGLLLDESYVKDLSKYRNNIYVYFGLKGITPQQFSELTLRSPEYWKKQINAIELLIKGKFRLGINIMGDYLSESGMLEFIEVLMKIDQFAPLAVDLQNVSIFPHVQKRLDEREIHSNSSKMTKKKYLDLIMANYPDIYAQGSKYIINRGMMTFLDFGE